MIYLTVDCYAEVSASHAYPGNLALQNWCVNGFMVAWQRHFLEVDEIEGESTD